LQQNSKMEFLKDTEVFTTDGKIVFCNPCEKCFVCDLNNTLSYSETFIKIFFVIYLGN